MLYEIIWYVDHVSEELIFGNSEQTKKRYILVTENCDMSEFPKSVMVDFLQNHISKLDWIEAGDLVRLQFSIRYSRHGDTKRIYNNLKGIKIEKLE